jgi:hypothetical protein
MLRKRDATPACSDVLGPNHVACANVVSFAHTVTRVTSAGLRACASNKGLCACISGPRRCVSPTSLYVCKHEPACTAYQSLCRLMSAGKDACATRVSFNEVTYRSTSTASAAPVRILPARRLVRQEDLQQIVQKPLAKRRRRDAHMIA